MVDPSNSVTALPTLAELVEVASAAKPRVSGPTLTTECCVKLGIPTSVASNTNEVMDALHAKIRAALAVQNANAWEHFRELQAQLIHEHIANDQALDPHFELIGRIRDAVSSSRPSEAHDGSGWRMAVQIAIDYLHLIPLQIHRPNYETIYRAEVERARASKRLREFLLGSKRGPIPYEMQIGHDISIARSLGRRVMRLGGIETAALLFHVLSSVYCEEHGCYHDVPQFPAPGEPSAPRIPFGLLLNLAAKYPLAKAPFRNALEDRRMLFQLAIDYATLHRAQSYSHMEWMQKNPSTILRDMQRLAIGDAFYFIEQLRPADAIKIMRGLVAALAVRCKINEAVIEHCSRMTDIAEAILRIAGDTRGPVVFAKDQLMAEMPGLPVHETHRILTEDMAHPRRPGANVLFTRPAEIPDDALPRHQRSAPNFGDRPLLSLDHGRFVLLDQSACSQAFVECLLTRLRSTVIESDIGDAVENFVRAELRSHGLDVKYGNHGLSAKKRDGECDAVIETENFVIFIEIKKKSLTRAARSGFDVAVLADTTNSMASALLQAGNHELLLRRNGSLRLTAADQAFAIELRGRTVVRIALSLFNYGGFQDRTVLRQVLAAQLWTSYAASNPDRAETLAEVNKKLSKLRKLNEELYALAGKPAQWHPFHDCWFLSVPQFLILLDEVNRPEDFERELRRTRGMTFGTRDFAYEYCRIRRQQRAVEQGGGAKA
jgi:Holliday junction resolvase-like predicted endonuclease